MRLQRIVDFDFRSGAMARERVIFTRGVVQRDVEVVNMIQLSRDGLAGGQRYSNLYRASFRITRRGATAAPGLEPSGLQCEGFIFLSDTRQVAGDRVTGAALPGCIEIGLALFGVTSNDIQKRVRGTMSGRVGLNVKPRHNIGYLRFSKIWLGHPLVGPALAQNRGNQDSLLVIEHQHRTDQVGRARTTLSVYTVAASAVCREEFGAARHGCGIFSGALDRSSVSGR